VFEGRVHKNTPFTSYGGREVIESDWFKNMMEGVEKDPRATRQVDWRNAWSQYSDADEKSVEGILYGGGIGSKH
jgi:hypothetical protein